jgi:ribonuclease HII
MLHRPDVSLESSLWRAGHRAVAGVDEAGRGAWAGPVVAAAVVLPSDAEDLLGTLADVNDSKLLTPSMRERCAALIVEHAAAWAVGFASEGIIDVTGIVGATQAAMRRAITRLAAMPEILVIDHLLLPGVRIPQIARPKADATHLSVAAASILAKVARDRYMTAVHQLLPQYGFVRNKGYGTPEHRELLSRHGISRFHRSSFQPMRQMLEERYGKP